MKLLIPIFLSTLAYSKDIDSNTLDGIYNEAILFVAIFGIMSIVSIIISKKNAKKYETNNPLEERKTARREEELKKKLSDVVVQRSSDRVDKLLHLSKMLEDKIISEDEFKMLKKEILEL